MGLVRENVIRVVAAVAAASGSTGLIRENVEIGFWRGRCAFVECMGLVRENLIRVVALVVAASGFIGLIRENMGSGFGSGAARVLGAWGRCGNA